MSVSMNPGAMTFAVMPRAPSSRVSERAKPTSAAFDDAAEAALQQPLRGPFHDSEGSGEVRVDDLGELLLAHAQQQGVAGDPGVRDDDLDRPQPRLDLGERRVDGSGVGHLGAHRERPLRPLARAGGHGDPVALREHPLGDGVADAAVAAGHENGAWGAHSGSFRRPAGARHGLRPA
jgi:hypothetical protein